jgi:malonyl-CoA O-methyltransferase
MNRAFDPRQVRRSFGRAAERYEASAVLQHEVEDRLLERLDLLAEPPSRVLDLGCGPGRAAAAIKRRWPRAQVIALDPALPMLQQARARSRWWRPLRCVQAEAEALPLAEGSIDLVFSSLALQWVQSLPRALGELRRVLRPGGLLLLSTFGPATLGELRAAFAAADETPHVSPFTDLQALGDALLSAGFRDPVADRDDFVLTYAAVRDLMRELRDIGAVNGLDARRRSLTGKSRMQAMIAAYESFRDGDGRLPASYEVLYAQAFAPQPGQPRRGDGGGEIAAVPVDSIPIRRRGA